MSRTDQWRWTRGLAIGSRPLACAVQTRDHCKSRGTRILRWPPPHAAPTQNEDLEIAAWLDLATPTFRFSLVAFLFLTRVPRGWRIVCEAFCKAFCEAFRGKCFGACHSDALHFLRLFSRPRPLQQREENTLN